MTYLKIIRFTSYTVFFLFCLTTCLFAQGPHEESNQEGDHHYHHNHVVFFAGAATTIKHSHTAFATGLEYEYRFLEKFGASILTEYLFADEKEIDLGIPLIWHPSGGLKIYASPLLVLLQVEDSSHPKEGNEWHNEFGIRIGTAYDFHFNNYSVGPEINSDFINNHTALIYGLTFGLGF